MTDHASRAVELFVMGYNCSQSVFAAYSDEMGLDMDTALRLSSSFGGGMGRLREVCGALSGAFMVFGMLRGYTDPTDSEAKSEHYKQVQEMAALFKAEHGSLLCRDLLGDNAGNGYVPENRTEDYYQKRPCAGLVAHAAALLDRMLEQTKTE
jgi:C_GCAxxG_C_C family probable redox protein